MIKYLCVSLTYDGSTQGNTDRDAFKSVLDGQLSGASVFLTISGLYNNIQTSISSVSNNTVYGIIQYSSKNNGVTGFNDFLTACQTEIAKTTVVNGSSISTHECFIDTGEDCDLSNIQTK